MTRGRVVTFRNLMVASGKSMSQIARECGISTPYVSKLAAGVRNPSAEIMVSLSNCLEVPVFDVLASFGLNPNKYKWELGYRMDGREEETA